CVHYRQDIAHCRIFFHQLARSRNHARRGELGSRPLGRLRLKRKSSLLVFGVEHFVDYVHCR
ncbi:MAG TPA: hypothetical protein VFZ51_00770, partial [Woeseiaceae bacterium]